MNANRSARRFFWAWLLGSAAVSTAAVVVHAMLSTARAPMIAAALASVVVLIQLCGTFGVHALMQAQIVGAAYRTAVATAAMLALGAFVLNYFALVDLAVSQAGIDTSIAWLVPCVVDLGMSASTVALFALTSAERGQVVESAPPAAPHAASPGGQHTGSVAHVEVRNSVHTEAALDTHERAAHRIVALGRVRIAPERVAQVLAEQSAGTAPSMIARRLGVGYSTVTRILESQSEAVL